MALSSSEWIGLIGKATRGNKRNLGIPSLLTVWVYNEIVQNSAEYITNKQWVAPSSNFKSAIEKYCVLFSVVLLLQVAKEISYFEILFIISYLYSIASTPHNLAWRIALSQARKMLKYGRRYIRNIIGKNACKSICCWHGMAFFFFLPIQSTKWEASEWFFKLSTKFLNVRAMVNNYRKLSTPSFPLGSIWLRVWKKMRAWKIYGG